MSTVYKRTTLTGGGAPALDGIDGAALADGDFSFVMASGDLYLYNLDASSGAVESSPDVIAPDLNAGSKRWILQRSPDKTPVGVITPFLGGYFGAAGNSTFTNVIGNDAATINTRLNPDGWHVCDGSALNDPLSPIFNGSGRYLPDLTDDRFIMGASTGGVTGGDNASAHTHTINHDHGSFTSGATTLTINQLAVHSHGTYGRDSDNSISGIIGFGGRSDWTERYYSGVLNGGGASHTHAVNPPAFSGTSGAASTAENRPKFLAAIYIMKVR